MSESKSESKFDRLRRRANLVRLFNQQVDEASASAQVDLWRDCAANLEKAVDTAKAVRRFDEEIDDGQLGLPGVATSVLEVSHA